MKLDNDSHIGQWVSEFPAEIMVCDRAGLILEMNKAAEELFAKDGGSDLLDKNVLDCHPEPSRTKLAEMLATGASNCAVAMENGARRIFLQIPWFRSKECAGITEISFILPDNLPHYHRD